MNLLCIEQGFDVEGKENLQEVLSKRLYLCQFLFALSILRPGMPVLSLHEYFLKISLILTTQIYFTVTILFLQEAILFASYLTYSQSTVSVLFILCGMHLTRYRYLSPLRVAQQTRKGSY